jgi:hypothetical protein
MLCISTFIYPVCACRMILWIASSQFTSDDGIPRTLNPKDRSSKISPNSVSINTTKYPYNLGQFHICWEYVWYSTRSILDDWKVMSLLQLLIIKNQLFSFKYLSLTKKKKQDFKCNHWCMLCYYNAVLCKVMPSPVTYQKSLETWQAWSGWIWKTID